MLAEASNAERNKRLVGKPNIAVNRQTRFVFELIFIEPTDLWHCRMSLGKNFKRTEAT